MAGAWLLARSRLPGARPLSRKHLRELLWWREQRSKFVPWYEGELDDLWGMPAPADHAKVRGFDPFTNAVLTFAKADPTNYPRRLLLSPNHFQGMTILDVGCGGLPYVLGFTGCRAFGVDPLVDNYRALGFPLDKYSDRLTYISAPAEEIPVEDGFFDAVISVNAIDHVDDFPAVAAEIERVVRPGGIVRFEAHYHTPSAVEPWALSDEIILRSLGQLGIRKVHERPVNRREEIYDLEEKLVVWATNSSVVNP